VIPCVIEKCPDECVTLLEVSLHTWPICDRHLKAWLSSIALKVAMRPSIMQKHGTAGARHAFLSWTKTEALGKPFEGITDPLP
jgi:hypothetical protein